MVEILLEMSLLATNVSRLAEQQALSADHERVRLVDTPNRLLPKDDPDIAMDLIYHKSVHKWDPRLAYLQKSVYIYQVME